MKPIFVHLSFSLFFPFSFFSIPCRLSSFAHHLAYSIWITLNWHVCSLEEQLKRMRFVWKLLKMVCWWMGTRIRTYLSSVLVMPSYLKRHIGSSWNFAKAFHKHSGVSTQKGTVFFFGLVFVFQMLLDSVFIAELNYFECHLVNKYILSELLRAFRFVRFDVTN